MLYMVTLAQRLSTTQAVLQKQGFTSNKSASPEGLERSADRLARRRWAFHQSPKLLRLCKRKEQAPGPASASAGQVEASKLSVSWKQALRPAVVESAEKENPNLALY